MGLNDEGWILIRGSLLILSENFGSLGLTPTVAVLDTLYRNVGMRDSAQSCVWIILSTVLLSRPFIH